MKKFKINKISIYLLSIFVLLGACKTRKVRPKAERQAIERNNAEKLLAVQQAQVNFNTLAIKAKAELEMNGSSNDVTINFRMLKDQKIWISVTAIAGLEVARMLITPDSIKILNRLESTYIKKPLSFVQSYTNEEINFGTLQSILVGNVFEEALKRKPQFSLTENKLQLTGRLAEMAYRIQFNDLFRAKETFFEDSLTYRQLAVKYDDFFIDAGLNLAHQVNFKSAVANKTIKAELKYTKLEKDVELDFPFSVPKRFSVKN